MAHDHTGSTAATIDCDMASAFGKVLGESSLTTAFLQPPPRARHPLNPFSPTPSRKSDVASHAPGEAHPVRMVWYFARNLKTKPIAFLNLLGNNRTHVFFWRRYWEFGRDVFLQKRSEKGNTKFPCSCRANPLRVKGDHPCSYKHTCGAT